jgi:hypothetical protein
LVKAAIAGHPAHRGEQPSSLGDLLISVRHLFKALAHAD